MTDHYQACLDFLYGRLNYERQGMPRIPGELRLGRMRRLLRRLGDPHLALNIIHVAGTKGKGSTSAMIASALSASGRKTGLFCSPHLNRLEERFCIDGREATAQQLVALIQGVREVVERLDAEHDARQHRGMTFFEITTAMGLLHFARENVGPLVLEVGMGGRLDSTNVVRPTVAVVTNISLDHTKQLGSTIGEIAREKAGIFKRLRPVVTGERSAEALDVIRNTAALRGSRLREIDRDFQYEYEPPKPPLTRPMAGRVSVKTWSGDWGTFDLPLFGAHQAQNVAVALATLDVLAENGCGVDREDVARGFAQLRWPARIELLGNAPWFVVDGAHNVAAAEALSETLETCFPKTSRTLIFGTTREKDLRGQLQALLPGIDRVVVTRYLENPRSVPPDEVAAVVLEMTGRRAIVTKSPATALDEARAVTPRDGLIVVTGSLFLAAEVRDLVFNPAYNLNYAQMIRLR